ncbi:SDR family NAD(P)-dependent oxidoreductase [Novosphingobium sp. P6W]|uniref:SDR family NAD(P)-dependent oxidoreductase n=1 Tax=Novosphingobium sp. P6W TaxID=1609758 RepID=UPI0005C2D4FB|nr:SDR family oxidoreductase [Novosphingobium sp. P6W]AXB76936.1 SDR family NAD(P)-dependent oxidoreductase [Novosphingobium sp. P6W]KIS33223.1 short-chain dehydrogenase [Novosphingobium sp. P6W]
MSEWRGRTAVITGGGRGFGKAFGVALALQGAHVVLVDIDGEQAEAAARDIQNRGGSALGMGGDVTNEGRMAEVMAQAAQANGGIDLLVNNAGLHSNEYGQPILKFGLAKVRRLFDVNVIGVVCCTLAAHPHMRGRVGASVVNISSSAAHLGGSPYGDSKLAVAGLTITFARELGPDGIRVNAISPGLILTETIRSELPEATKQRVQAMQMISGDGQEDDIVEALLYLASGKARFVTGETLRVTGGMAAGV